MLIPSCSCLFLKLVQPRTQQPNNEQYYMQNYCKTIGALAAASALVAGTASAEVEYAINGGYHNEYLFRGGQLGDDMVTSGVDAATTYAGLGLSAGLWYADFTTGGNANTNELDIYGEVSKELDLFTAAIGYIKYVNEDNGAAGSQDDAQEIYFGLSREFYGIETSLTYFWDIETDNDGYSELALGKSFDLNSCWSLGLSTALGYSVEQGEFENWMTTASLDYAISETATLSPYVMYVVDGEANAIYETNNEQEFVGGVNLSVSF